MIMGNRIVKSLNKKVFVDHLETKSDVCNDVLSADHGFCDLNDDYICICIRVIIIVYPIEAVSRIISIVIPADCNFQVFSLNDGGKAFDDHLSSYASFRVVFINELLKQKILKGTVSVRNNGEVLDSLTYFTDFIYYLRDLVFNLHYEKVFSVSG